MLVPSSEAPIFQLLFFSVCAFSEWSRHPKELYVMGIELPGGVLSTIVLRRGRVRAFQLS